MRAHTHTYMYVYICLLLFPLHFSCHWMEGVESCLVKYYSTGLALMKLYSSGPLRAVSLLYLIHMKIKYIKTWQLSCSFQLIQLKHRPISIFKFWSIETSRYDLHKLITLAFSYLYLLFASEFPGMHFSQQIYHPIVFFCFLNRYSLLKVIQCVSKRAQNRMTSID